MKRILLITVFVSTATFGQTSQHLSLEDAIRNGLKYSKMLRVSSAKVEAADAKKGEARASLLPTVKIEGSYKRLSDVDPFRVQLPGAPVPFTISPTVIDNYSVRGSIQQPLFTGFKLSSNARAAERLAEAAEFDNRNDRADLTLNITTAYWMLYQVRENKKFVEENIKRLESYKRDAEYLLKSGMATRNDLLKVQVQLSSAKLSLIDAENDAEVALMNLNNIIGQPLETNVELASTPEQSASGDIGLDSMSVPPASLVNKALNGRSDVQAMQLRVEASEATVNAAQGNWWPQIFLAGNYYYSRPNVRYLPTRDEFKSTWDVGVVVQLDVWNWGATAFQVEQAQAALTQNRSLFDQMKDNVALEVKRLYLSVMRAKEKVDVARLGIEQAEENSRSSSDKFKSGLATTSDLLDASVALMQSKINLIAALVEFQVAKARLAKATGGSN